MNTVYRIASIVALVLFLKAPQLSANEPTNILEATPCISVDRLDFGKVLVNKTMTLSAAIFNHGSSQLTITGYSFFSGNTEEIYQTSLGTITPEKTLHISAGQAVTFEVTFKPKEYISYPDKIIFVSDADETCTGYDPVLELNGAGTNLLIEPISDVTIPKNSTVNIPIITNSTKPSTLKITMANEDSSLVLKSNMLITGSGNNYNLEITPLKDSTGSCYLQVDAEDEFRTGSTSFKFTVEGGGAAEDNPLLNNDISIYPNPVNCSSMNIKYELPYDCTVLLSLYNSSGILISNLLSAYKTTGCQLLSIPVSGLAAGMYFIEFKAGDMVGHKSFIIVK